jgi:hypothetical protein
MSPLKVQLFPKNDTDDQVFYIGKLRFNGSLNVGKGQSFLIYLDDDVKELHIAPSDCMELTDVFKYYKAARRKSSRSRHNNIAVELQSIEAEDGKSFYIGRLECDATVDASEGLVFLVFTADPGEEELQISSPEQKNSKNKKLLKAERKFTPNS